MGGGEKSLLPLLGAPLLRHCITRLAPQVDMLAINANREVDTYAGFGLPVIRDTIPDYAGPLAGVLAGMRWAADAGASACIQPGGSIRDDEVIKAADERELAMVFTGHRHFRH